MGYGRLLVFLGFFCFRLNSLDHLGDSAHICAEVQPSGTSFQVSRGGLKWIIRREGAAESGRRCSGEGENGTDLGHRKGGTFTGPSTWSRHGGALRSGSLRRGQRTSIRAPVSLPSLLIGSGRYRALGAACQLSVFLYCYVACVVFVHLSLSAIYAMSLFYDAFEIQVECCYPGADALDQ